MFDCHCDVFVFRNCVLVSDYDDAKEIQSACARVEDGHQAYVKITFQPTSLTACAAEKHMSEWNYTIDTTYLPDWWASLSCIPRATARAEFWRQARVFAKEGLAQICGVRSQGHTYFVFGKAKVVGFNHCVVHAYGNSEVVANEWCRVYAHDCSDVSARDNSYVELRDGSTGSILNGRMDMCSSASGEYQGFSTGHVYGKGFAYALDNSCVSVYGKESKVIGRGQSIVSRHDGSVNVYDSAILIDENPDDCPQQVYDHAQKILRR